MPCSEIILVSSRNAMRASNSTVCSVRSSSRSGCLSSSLRATPSRSMSGARPGCRLAGVGPPGFPRPSASSQRDKAAGRGARSSMGGCAPSGRILRPHQVFDAAARRRHRPSSVRWHLLGGRRRRHFSGKFFILLGSKDTRARAPSRLLSPPAAVRQTSFRLRGRGSAAVWRSALFLLSRPSSICGGRSLRI